MEFEGQFVRNVEGRLPQINLEMAEGYVRGTHLVMRVELRVRNVRFEEDRRGDLTRQHLFALEEAKLLEAFDPVQRPTNVGGSLAGDHREWLSALLAYIEGEAEVIDFDGEVPERLKLMIEDSELREAYGDGPDVREDAPLLTDSVPLTDPGF